MPSQDKINYVDSLHQALKDNPQFVLINFGGATHHELEDLRTKLFELSLETRLRIVKNSLFKVALAKLNRTAKLMDHDSQELVVGEILRGPSALLFLPVDYLAALKAVWEFAKTREDVSFKIGFIEGAVYESTSLIKLANLPSFEELVAKIIGSFKSPQTRFVRSLQFNTSKLIYVLRQASQN